MKLSVRNAGVYSGRNAQLHEVLTRRQLSLPDRNDALRKEPDSLEKLQAYTKTTRETFIEKLGGIPKRDCPSCGEMQEKSGRKAYTGSRQDT